MERVSRSETKIYHISNNAISYEYPTNNKDINIAFVEINGRYPDEGYCLNEICTESCYVIDGSGKLYVDNMEYELEKDTVVIINPGELYYYVGDLRLCVPSTPAWTPEQHKKVLVKK